MFISQGSCRSMVIESWDGRPRIAPSSPTFYDHRTTILQLTTRYLNCYWDCVFKGFHASRKRTDMTASGWKEKSLIIHVRCVAWQQIGEGTWIYKCPTSSKFGNLLFVCTYLWTRTILKVKRHQDRKFLLHLKFSRLLLDYYWTLK